MIQVGDTAPDFELLNTEGGKTKLSDFRGQKHVLLVFFPFAFSARCTTEFCTLRDENLELVSDESVEVLGISCDHLFALKAWKQAEKYPNTFLSDFWPHGAVAQAYGVFADAVGCAKRIAFLVDKDGVVRYVDENPSGDIRDQGAWRSQLAEIGA